MILVIEQVLSYKIHILIEIYSCLHSDVFSLFVYVASYHML